MRKFVFAMLIFSFLAFPGQAGTNLCLSFEDSSTESGSYSDLIFSETPSYRLSSAPSWASIALYYPKSKGYNCAFSVGSGFDTYLGYTRYGAGWYLNGYKECSTNHKLTAYNSSGIPLFSLSCGTPRAKYQRIEVIKSTSGYNMYADGNLVSSAPFDFLDSIAYFTCSDYHSSGRSNERHIQCAYDDFSTSYWSLSGNDALSGSTYTLSYGVAPSSSRTQLLKLFSPDGDLISSSDLGSSSAGVVSFDAALFDKPGDYSLRLYAVYTGGSVNYLSSKSISVGGSSSSSDCKIELNKESYSAGEEVLIYTFSSPYKNGYNLLLYSKKSLEKTISITSQDQNSKYTIPNDALTGNWLAVLKNPSGKTEVKTTFSVMGNLYPDTSIKFDKSGYVLGDKINIFYDDLPPGTTVLLKGSMNSETIFSETWENRAGAGIIPYTLPDSKTYEVVQVYASNDGMVLDSDLSMISLGSDYILEGTILNSVTNSPISSGEVTLNGVTKLINEKGHYEIKGPAGAHSIYIKAPGFHSASFDVTLSSPLTSRNFYLLPVTETTGGSIYGATADYDTGKPAGLAIVEIYNDTASYQTISNSNTGHFQFFEIPNGSTWNIRASKGGYFNYEGSVTVSGDTLHMVRLVSDGPGSGDSSGGSSSGSTDGPDKSGGRPGRQAARDSMAEFEAVIPGLMGFIVFAIFIKTFENL